MSKQIDTPPRQEGDGLLPGSSSPPASRREPRWLPWVLLGGGALVAGGIVWTANKRTSR